MSNVGVLQENQPCYKKKALYHAYQLDADLIWKLPSLGTVP